MNDIPYFSTGRIPSLGEVLADFYKQKGGPMAKKKAKKKVSKKKKSAAKKRR